MRALSVRRSGGGVGSLASAAAAVRRRVREGHSAGGGGQRACGFAAFEIMFCYTSDGQIPILREKWSKCEKNAGFQGFDP